MGTRGERMAVIEPSGVSDVIDQIFGSLGMASMSIQRRLQNEWEELVGPQWSKHTQPVVLVRGTLKIETASPMVRSTLRFGTEALKQKLNQELGGEHIREIQLLVSPDQTLRT